MKTRTINIYTFAELSPTVQQKAMDDDAAQSGYTWSREALASLAALAVHFSGKLTDYNIDFFGDTRSSASFDMPEEDSDGFSRAWIEGKLGELGSYNPETLKGNGDCKLTGYSADEDAIDGFRAAFIGGESNLSKLMQAAFKSWLKACQADCASFYSVEKYKEHADANEWEYLENGELA